MARDYNAEYYDLTTTDTEDVGFYLDMAAPTDAVLELGCGTGRVSIPLADHVQHLTAVDISKSMLDRGRNKDVKGRVEFIEADITAIDLGQQYNLIIAPYRVLQALEHNEQIDGFFDGIRRHLKRDGRAIVNVFHPRFTQDTVAQTWPRQSELQVDEVRMPNGDTLKVYEVQRRVDVERQVIYPELIYRRHRGGRVIDEHINPICMRYYFPNQFLEVIRHYGFDVVDQWGGYENEVYGQGRALIAAFVRR